jgi:5-formyltetrahydrofolate cyclo-ligase
MTLKSIREQFDNSSTWMVTAPPQSRRAASALQRHGYFDLEWAFFFTIGVVNIDTPVFCVGHDCQVVDVDVTVEPYDTAIDYIVTPTRVIRTRNEFPKPQNRVYWSLLAPGMREKIPPLQELWMDQFCK